MDIDLNLTKNDHLDQNDQWFFSQIEHPMLINKKLATYLPTYVFKAIYLPSIT